MNWRSWVVLTKSDSLNHFFASCVLPLFAFQRQTVILSPWTSLHSKWRESLSWAMQTRMMPMTSTQASITIFSSLQATLANPSKSSTGLRPTKSWTWIKQSNRLQLMADQQSERIKVLNHINFLWTTGTHQKRWSMHYEELVEFHSTNSHCIVSRACSLGQWVNNQRRSKKKGKLSAEWIKLLDILGF